MCLPNYHALGYAKRELRDSSFMCTSHQGRMKKNQCNRIISIASSNIVNFCITSCRYTVARLIVIIGILHYFITCSRA